MGFLIVFSSVLAALHAYVGLRLIRSTAVPKPYSVLAWIACALLCLSIPATFFFYDRASSVTYAFHFGAYLWLGCAFYLWTLLLASDAVRGVRALARKLAPRAVPSAVSSDAPPEDPARRVLLARSVASGAALATLGIAGMGVRSALGEITTPEVTVRLARLPRALDGFHIAQLSDVHVGPLLGERFVRAVVERTNQLRPDLIVITGDLVDGSVSALRPNVGLLAGLRSRYGTYFVTGNHEYYSGCDEWNAFLRSLGVHVLMNERVAIGDAADGGGKKGASFDLLGVPDHHAGRYHPIGADMWRASRGRDPERELVVLAHQPVQIADARAIGAGLQLSGHTHGGQMQPFGQIVALAQPFVAGLHRDGHTQIYVSRGTGFWGPPMRVLAPAEITSLRLVRG